MNRVLLWKNNPFVRYLAPFFLFLFLSIIQDLASTKELFWGLYAAKMILPALVIIFFFKGYWHEVSGKFDPLAIVVGLGVLAIWIINYKFFSPDVTTASFDISVLPLYSAAVVVSIKLLGSTIIIPLIEELVWRSFLMRYLIKIDFLSVPLGTYTHLSFWFAALTFAAMHPMWQWGAALAAAAAYGYYLVMTKNLVGCMIAHAVTNCGLGIYVLATQNWELWV